MDIEKSYTNAYKLLIGETNYDQLASQSEFYLPVDHEDPAEILKYFEEIEDYEKCAIIRDSFFYQNKT
jgi:hypothetical protein